MYGFIGTSVSCSVGRAMFMFMLCYVMGQHAMHREVVHSWSEVMWVVLVGLRAFFHNRFYSFRHSYVLKWVIIYWL